MLSSRLQRWTSADPDLKAFLLGILLLGVNQGILNSTFNNFLDDSFGMSASARGILEFPRELPGFLLVFVTGALAAWSMRGWAILAGLLSAVGVAGLACLSPSVLSMTVWMMLWSLADHLFMPIESAVGLRLSRAGSEGRRLGQISGARNLAMILGAGVAWVLAGAGGGKEGGAYYSRIYLIAVAAALASSWAFARLDQARQSRGARRLVVRREYRWFYWLNVLFGARKQIFLTFAPWVLVTVFGTPAKTMALLFLSANVLGVVFRQAFGVAVDRFGERKVFYADALILLAICAGFALSKNVRLLYALYVLDNLMFATRIARTTYLDKIAVERGDIPATLSLGVTMDHVASMTVPVLGGLLWASCGYPAVFWSASLLAGAVLFVARRVETPGAYRAASTSTSRASTSAREEA